MIDLHVHTLLSDGTLLPTELVRRVEMLDYEAVALTDHVDAGNLESVIAAGRRVAESLNGVQPVKVVPGVELTHVPPPLIRQLKPGGRMVIPVGAQFMTQLLLLLEKDADGTIVTRQIGAVRFVPLTGEH